VAFDTPLVSWILIIVIPQQKSLVLEHTKQIEVGNGFKQKLQNAM
jgi:hypothetical protein